MSSKTHFNLLQNERPRLLNIGCGRRFHPLWQNIDLQSHSSHVVAHNVIEGLPCDSSSLDAVYHSHVLEHLKTEQAKSLLQECYRVLKPGGVLRIVVPDLERIAALYLEMHEKAWNGDAAAKQAYHWMKLELLDQMVREQSGGQMGRAMISDEVQRSEFVYSRFGDELRNCVKPTEARSDEASSASKPPKMLDRWRAKWGQAKEKLAMYAVRKLMGRQAKQALQVGLFRSHGEIHQWMYDRFSLRSLCGEIGFTNFTVCTATESGIEDFAQYELDSENGRVRKPDSLFVECRKPAVAASRAVA